jgi:membrane protease YdiL (CAAX protease family)
MPLGHAIQAVYDHFGRPVPRQEIVDQALGAHGLEVIVFAVSAIVLAPFSEEVFFRGTLLPAIGRSIGPHRANLLQAMIFGAIHIVDRPEQWPLAIPLALVGWCAGWIYLRTASLAAPILLHATFNAINFAAMRFS